MHRWKSLMRRDLQSPSLPKTPMSVTWVEEENEFVEEESKIYEKISEKHDDIENEEIKQES